MLILLNFIDAKRDAVGRKEKIKKRIISIIKTIFHNASFYRINRSYNNNNDNNDNDNDNNNNNDDDGNYYNNGIISSNDNDDDDDKNDENNNNETTEKTTNELKTASSGAAEGPSAGTLQASLRGTVRRDLILFQQSCEDFERKRLAAALDSELSIALHIPARDYTYIIFGYNGAYL